MTTANRMSGVAPLAVFFDAVDDVDSSTGNRTFAWRSGVHQPTDKEGTHYSWDFGDPGSGSWSLTTGNSKNTATGYTAAHVYENPATYTVTLTQTDTSGAVRTYTQRITVTAFSGATYYVAATGRDSNDGRSTSTPFQTLAHAMTKALAASGPVQVLFRRGDTFSATRAYPITKAGPGIIGAYGAGARPIINCAELGEVNIFSPRGPGTDWRIMDLEMAGPSTSTATGPVGPPPTAQGVNTLILRLKVRSWNVGIGWGDWTPIYSTPHDGMFVVESEILPTGNCSLFVGGRRLALLGNNAHDNMATHVLRVWQMYKGVISNNRLWNPGPTRHSLKLHSTTIGDGRPETRWVSISDNMFRGKTWTAAIGAQDIVTNERPTHVIFERNRFWAESTVQVDLLVHDSADVIVRNNVFDARGAHTGYRGIVITNLGGVLTPGDHVRVYNNTVSRIEKSREFTAVEVSGGMTHVTVRNNFSAPVGATQPEGVNGIDHSTAGAGLVVDHNISSTSPQFADVASGDFKLTAGSPAANAGATAFEAREDFLRVSRPVGSAYDVGAYENR